MPSTKTIKNYFKFIGGLITEATPFTYPPNSCLDMSNFDLYRSGLIARRRGLTAESEYVLQPDTPFSEAIVQNGGIGSFVWTSPADNGANELLTVQIGKDLYFHDLTSNSSISGSKLAATVDMTPYLSNLGGDPGKYKITTTSILGYQYITSPILDFFYLEYDEQSEDITAASEDPMIRDLEGLEDGLEPDENPTTLSPEHHYNLLNQGWTEDTITAYFTQFKNYPSNSQVWWESKTALGVFNPAGMADIQFGTGQAAKGHFMLNLYKQDRSAVSGIPGLDVVTIGQRASGMASWLGRLFIAINNIVYFSQIIQSPDDAYKFYQEADPASEVDPALVASDGGVIPISNCGQINVLLVTQTALIIGASNGIWALTAYSGGEFNATSFRTLFISNIGVGSPDNICVVENNVVVVSDGGIYSIGTSDRGNPVITNLTEKSIQTFYLNIPRSARRGSAIAYDSSSKKIYMYYDADADIREGLYRNQYDSALILDVSIGAWYPYSIAHPDQYDTGIYGVFLLNTPQIIGLEQNVIDNDGVQVITNNGTPVTVIDKVPLINQTAIGYLLVSGQDGEYNYTFGEFSNQGFYDWDYLDGGATSYDSYLVTGYEIAEDMARRKGAPYMWMAFERTETQFLPDSEGNLVFDFPSALWCVSQWDWANQYSYFRKSTPQQLYRLSRFVSGNPGGEFEYPSDVVETRTSLRGHGKALSLYLYSEEGKDARILAWALELQIKTTP